MFLIFYICRYLYKLQKWEEIMIKKDDDNNAEHVDSDKSVILTPL